MHMSIRVPHRVKPLVTGAALMVTVSLGTAAIVMWIPESPVQVFVATPAGLALQALPDPTQSQPRNAALPAFLQVQPETSAR